MAYEDRVGSTTIIDEKIDHLVLHWDYDDDINDKAQRFPVLFFTPDMDNTDEHYHIRLDREKAQVMRDWLDKFLKDK